MGYEVERREAFTTNIKAKREGYTLKIRDYPKWVDHTPAMFSVERREDHGNFLITGRDLKEYHYTIGERRINPLLLYVEVGAGLGEFIPSVVHNNPLQKPIVIDPANYKLMLEMLLFAESLPVKEETKRRLKIYQERCRLFLNKDKIWLINLNLEDAFRQYPELQGIADVVIDNFGAGHYASDKQATEELERRLLKHTGILYSSSICILE